MSGGLLNVKVELPPEVGRLAARVDALAAELPRAVEAAWLDGLRTGLLVGLAALVCVLVFRRK